MGKLFYPSAEHPPNLVHFFRDRDVFFIVERLRLPCDLQKEFCEVELSACLTHKKEALFWRRVACEKERFGGRKEMAVNFLAQRETGGFREMRYNFSPQLVYCNQLLNYRQLVASGGGL